MTLGVAGNNLWTTCSMILRTWAYLKPAAQTQSNFLFPVFTGSFYSFSYFSLQENNLIIDIQVLWFVILYFMSFFIGCNDMRILIMTSYLLVAYSWFIILTNLYFNF